ncbi:MAG: hypothetical protein IAE82_12780 [Opitutaceae bacterium]|nr:hypothetical protein [Opitutaceae bacterium]
MNKISFASIAALATALIASPAPAFAGHHHHDHDDDEVIAAIGGFIGGVIVGSAITNGAPPPPPSARVEVSYGNHGGRHGHWEWRTVRVWVPGRWAYVDRDCGRPRRVWIEGYHDRRRERVWVSHHHDHRCERGCR